MARGYTRRNYVDEVSSFATQTKDVKRQIFNNIAATINARIKQFDGVTSLSSDLMDEIRKLQKHSPEMFTKNGNLKRSTKGNIDKEFLDLVNVLYTLDNDGKPTTRETAKAVKQKIYDKIKVEDLQYIKHIQHKAKGLGLEEELEKKIGTNLYMKAKRKTSDDEDDNNITNEEELNMNNVESKLKESGLTPEQWLDATTLAYIGHIMKKYGK